MRVLAQCIPPYFERSYRHFSSHRQTPPDPAAPGEPGILQFESCIHIASPLFTDYMINGYRIHREILRRSIELLTGDPLIVTDLPSYSEVTVRKKEDALIVHLLNYACRKKCRKLEIVEDVCYVPDCTLQLRVGKKPETVRLVPEGTDIPFTFEAGRVRIRPGEISGHTMIEIR